MDFQPEPTGDEHWKYRLQQEIDHRIRNNFQILLSICAIQEAFDTMEAEERGLEALKGRLHALVAVYDSLDAVREYPGFDLAQFLSSFTQFLVRFGGQKSCGCIEYEIDIAQEKVLLKSDTVVAVGLILFELVKNAWHHAFGRTGGAACLISIVSRVADGNTCLVSVSDNGIGLPETFNLSRDKRCGLLLVHALVDQIRGRLKHRFDGTGGLSWSLVFPAP